MSSAAERRAIRKINALHAEAYLEAIYHGYMPGDSNEDFDIVHDKIEEFLFWLRDEAPI